MGTAHTGKGVWTFHHKLETLQPPIGVLVTPSELADFRIAGPVWAQHFWVDSAAIGDLLLGRWNVFLRTKKPLTLPTIGYATGMTMVARYLDIDEEAAKDPPGTMRKYATPYSLGLVQEIAATDQSRRYRLLSRNSQIAAQSLHDVWQTEVYFPE